MLRTRSELSHASNGHIRWGRCSTDLSKMKTGFAPPSWPGECEERTRQFDYFPSEMVKSTELPGLPEAATVTVLVPWNRADEISIFLVSPFER